MSGLCLFFSLQVVNVTLKSSGNILNQEHIPKDGHTRKKVLFIIKMSSKQTILGQENAENATPLVQVVNP